MSSSRARGTPGRLSQLSTDSSTGRSTAVDKTPPADRVGRARCPRTAPNSPLGRKCDPSGTSPCRSQVRRSLPDTMSEAPPSMSWRGLTDSAAPHQAIARPTPALPNHRELDAPDRRIGLTRPHRLRLMRRSPDASTWSSGAGSPAPVMVDRCRLPDPESSNSSAGSPTPVAFEVSLETRFSLSRWAISTGHPRVAQDLLPGNFCGFSASTRSSPDPT
jgi:hypothetical protein